ncbi:hypothetical protein JCM6882_001670 [Rhodosporidiobolus microsporus]
METLPTYLTPPFSDSNPLTLPPSTLLERLPEPDPTQVPALLTPEEALVSALGSTRAKQVADQAKSKDAALRRLMGFNTVQAEEDPVESVRQGSASNAEAQKGRRAESAMDEDEDGEKSEGEGGDKEKSTAVRVPVDRKWVKFSFENPHQILTGGHSVLFTVGDAAPSAPLMLSNAPEDVQRTLVRRVLQFNMDGGRYNLLPPPTEEGVDEILRLAAAYPMSLFAPFLTSDEPDSAFQPIPSTPYTRSLANGEVCFVENVTYLIEFFIKNKTTAFEVLDILEDKNMHAEADKAGVGASYADYVRGLRAFADGGGWKDEAAWRRFLSYAGWTTGKRWSFVGDKPFKPRFFEHFVGDGQSSPSLVQFLLRTFNRLTLEEDLEGQTFVSVIGTINDVDRASELTLRQGMQSEAFLSAARASGLASGGANDAPCDGCTNAGHVLTFLRPLPPQAFLRDVVQLPELPISIALYLKRAFPLNTTVAAARTTCVRRVGSEKQQEEEDDESASSRSHGQRQHEVHLTNGNGTFDGDDSVIQTIYSPQSLAKVEPKVLTMNARDLALLQRESQETRDEVNRFKHEAFYPSLVRTVGTGTRWAGARRADSFGTVLSPSTVREGVELELVRTNKNRPAAAVARVVWCCGTHALQGCFLVSLKVPLPSMDHYKMVTATWNDDDGRWTVRNGVGKVVSLSTGGTGQVKTPWKWSLEGVLSHSRKSVSFPSSDELETIIKNVLAM